MTTKGPSRKKIIIPMNNDNKTKFIALSSNYIANLNKALKNIKSDVIVDYAYMDQNNIIIVTNKIAFLSNLQIIENYIKNIEYINSEDIETSCLSQLKSYLKIIGIPYLMENTNMCYNSKILKLINKKNLILG